MVLVDTSVWVRHFREGEPGLTAALEDGQVLTHPFVLGELACGNLKHRASLLADLHALPAAQAASDREVEELVESRKLWGRGLGWIDMHLLASALLTGCTFRTLDKRLGETARLLGIPAEPEPAA